MSDISSSQSHSLLSGGRMRGRGSETRLRHSSMSSQERRGMPEVLFSDEEYDNAASPASSLANDEEKYEKNTRASPVGDAKKQQKVSFSLPPHHNDTKDEQDEVEHELDLFSKAIHISNIDEIDHVGLMRGMHERFQRKQLKWQRYASSYSKWAFSINFMILVMQIIQMLFHQLVEVFSGNSSSSTDSESQYQMPRTSFYGSYTFQDTELQRFLFNGTSLRGVRCVLSALTAALAGLQLKLKLTEKAEKYRRGAKVYARLHRLSTYYLMLAENGGKVEDVTGLWRNAMKKEGKWIPVVKTFMAT